MSCCSFEDRGTDEQTDGQTDRQTESISECILKDLSKYTRFVYQIWKFVGDEENNIPLSYTRGEA